MMKMRSLLLVAVLTLTGCAMPVLRPEVATDLRQSKMAAAVYLESKTIVYNEMVYKVLWNENRQNISHFDGLWDVDQALSEQLASDMSALGLQAAPIRSILASGTDYAPLENAIRTADGAGEQTPMQLDESTLGKLRKAGVGYLVVLRGAGFNLSTTTMNSSGGLNLPAILFIYDIRQNRQEYREAMFSSAWVTWGKTPRNIEAKGMAIVKEAASNMIKTSVDNNMPKIFGLAQAE